MPNLPAGQRDHDEFRGLLAGPGVLNEISDHLVVHGPLVLEIRFTSLLCRFLSRFMYRSFPAFMLDSLLSGLLDALVGFYGFTLGTLAGFSLDA